MFSEIEGDIDILSHPGLYHFTRFGVFFWSVVFFSHIYISFARLSHFIQFCEFCNLVRESTSLIVTLKRRLAYYVTRVPADARRWSAVRAFVYIELYSKSPRSSSSYGSMMCFSAICVLYRIFVHGNNHNDVFVSVGNSVRVPTILAVFFFFLEAVANDSYLSPLPVSFIYDRKEISELIKSFDQCSSRQ